MIHFQWRLPSYPKLVAFAWAATFKLCEICCLTLLALVVLGPASDLWRPFAVACCVSVGAEMLCAVWRRLHRVRGQ